MVRRVSTFAVMVAIFLIIIKTVAWKLSGSVAVLGSLFDSLFDFLISAINFWVVRHSMTPADKEHRYGHGKAEALAALAQAIIITLSVGFLITEVIRATLNPQTIAYSTIAIGVMITTIILTLVLSRIQKHVADKTKSVAIEADSAHYQGDLIMNLGVIIAIIASGIWKIEYADPIIGVVVAIIILRNAWKIGVAAINQLMDRELDDKTRDTIKKIIRSHPKVQNLHDLRTRRAGMRSFAQCHIELDGKMSLEQAHKISDEVEDIVIKTFPQLEVIIHQDVHGQEIPTELEKT